MVLFNNIEVGQVVEVLMPNNVVELAKVRYKGSLNLYRGDWVGLEMARKIGNNDGMIDGRRYFIVRADYGYFTTPDKIRFRPIKRKSYMKYRSVVSDEPDEELFQTPSKEVSKKQNETNNKSEDKVIISVKKHLVYQSPDLANNLEDTRPHTVQNYHLRHHMGQIYQDRQKNDQINQGIYDEDKEAIKKKLLFNEMWKPESERNSILESEENMRKYVPKKYHFDTKELEERKDYFWHPTQFLSPASIPDYFIPRHQVLEVLKRKNLERLHMPKTHTHYMMRDLLHRNNRESGMWWNDVNL